ncbi:MAG: bifunctional shikimate kinase/3-dehydroquinate synthase [Actinomycetota bacterium]
MNRIPLPAPRLPPGSPQLVVTGFMGTGKTTAGRRAAELLELPFFDLDEVVQERAGMPIDTLIFRRGETAFRSLERAVVADAARLSGALVATGGGAPTDRGSFAALADDAETAVLVADPAALRDRLGAGDGRPLLGPNPGARIDALLAERADAYRAAGHAVETSNRSLEAVAAELVERYRRRRGSGPARIFLETPGGSSEVVVGAGVLATVGRRTTSLVLDARRAAVVADPAVIAAAEAVTDALSAAGLHVLRIEVPSGEPAKSVEVVSGLWSSFRESGLDPGDVVVAVGGGATLDAAGFAAATYTRGVALVNVPTTLLAMADAAIGGKVAIDHAGAKNTVGAFHHPRLVIADPDLLATLAPVLAGGMAEVVKAAVLASPLVLEHLERDPDAGHGWIVEQAVRIKAAYVAADPFDRGLRWSLNLGHTFGHAIEAASGYRVSHGDAVAAGLVAAARLGATLGTTDPNLAERLAVLVERFGLPSTPPDGLDREDLLRAMAADKKRRGGRAAFVVPAPGGAELVEGLDPREAIAALLPESVGDRR